MKEQLLSDYDKTSISSENLQNELNRIVRDTKNATRLNQYFSLFDNNANSIVKCLVRPIVVKNLWRKNTNATKIYRDQKNLLAVPETTEFDYIIPKFHNDKEFLAKNTLSQESDIWLTMSSADAPQARYYHTAVWAGSEMIVWGGFSYFDTGGRYVVDGNWTATGSNNAPSGRDRHTGVWAGDSMIIWGGDTIMGRTNTGAIYFPDELIFANGFE